MPIAPLAEYFHVVVISPALPAKTLQEFVAYAKANPGKLNFGIGLGTMPQIIGEYFNLVAGLDIVTVPYAGGEQVRVDILGGRIHMNVGPPTNLMGLIAEGKLRPIAVTSKQRMKDLPDVPTMIESGYPQVGFHPDVWQGILAPAGTPAAIVERLNTEINAVLKMPDVAAEPHPPRGRRHHDDVGVGVRGFRRQRGHQMAADHQGDRLQGAVTDVE